MANSALTPTPMRLNDSTIRVYSGFRDGKGVSRIGYVDVLVEAATRVVGVSRRPVLDIGRNGCFDDNGVILGDVVVAADGIYMFYVGFQLVAKAKFLAFTGLAKSRDGGESFSRVSEGPILDRGPGQTTIGAVHSVMFEQGLWKMWYACGDDWEYVGGKPYPQYHIRYVETTDLMAVPRVGRECLKPRGNEYRIGRPRVYRVGGKYVMYFTYGTTSGDYLPGIAYSVDGIEWVRKDEDVGITLSPSGWDSRTLCYPALIQHRDDVLMFYNGNDMGADGVGLARAKGALD
ncbi:MULTISPECIES: glucosyl hydrolase [unclassified Bradyrhizobium]|uniref:glucosyl hydrolase n=1 Tax=unclassified Bradyrhizobium TaxID=2631580 RepID=UPI001FF8615B|nr:MULTISPECIES: glucosyl hydrolase [unclassified Bradyrhizobium]